MSLINKHSLGLSSHPLATASADGAPPDASLLAFFTHGEAPAATPAFSTIYAFGDSLSDAGNDYISSFHLLPSSPPYSHGRFSNGNVWVQDLAKMLHLHVPGPSLNGGTDYAYGGAETGQEPLHAAVPIDLPTQLLTFEASHLRAPAAALYTLSIGANDLLDAIPKYASDPGTALADLNAAVANEVQFVRGLIDWGAKTFDILNVPDLGKTPEEISAHTTATATSLSAQYDAALAASLGQLAAQTGATINIVDTFTLIDEGVADPGAFGFTNVTTPVWTGDYFNPFSGHLNAHGAAQNTYLFFDQLHPTAGGHSVIATAALTSLGTQAGT